MGRNAGAAAVPAPVARSLANAAPRVYWLDQRDAPEPLPALAGSITADLAIVGDGTLAARGPGRGGESRPGARARHRSARRGRGAAGTGLAAVPRRAALRRRQRDARAGQAGLGAAPCLP